MKQVSKPQDFANTRVVKPKITGKKITLEDMATKVAKDIGLDVVITPTKMDAVGDVDSDARGSGARYNSGKPDFSLIPLTTLEGEARVWAFGAKKYKSWNWLKGMDWSVPYASAMRHLAAWQSGEDVDKETGLKHIDHAICNLRMLTYYAENYKEGDNRPKQFFENKG